jgi:hypothetical protein
MNLAERILAVLVILAIVAWFIAREVDKHKKTKKGKQ